LAIIISAATREKIRVFILAGREVEPATEPSISPAVEVEAGALDAVPVEADLVQAMEPVSAGSGPMPAVDSITEGDGDESKNGVAK